MEEGDKPVKRDKCETEPDGNMVLVMTRRVPVTPSVVVTDEKVAVLAYKWWKKSQSNDAVHTWYKARDLLVHGGCVSSEFQVSDAAYFLWRDGFSCDAHTNWHEARRRVAASLVWGNPFLRMMIIARCDDQTNLLSISKMSEELRAEVRKFLLWRSRIMWRRHGWEAMVGRVQVVINEARGEVHLAPMRGFHPTMAFDF